MKNLTIAIGATLVVVFSLSPRIAGQRGAQPPPGAVPPGEVVVGSGNYSPIVSDLDKAIEFYGSLLGLMVPPAQAPGPRPFSTDPAIRNMFGIPSAQLRWVVARVPGPNLGVEMVEAKDIERKPVNPRPQDPGSMTLVLIVRDIDKAFAPLKAGGVPVVTPGGAPLTFGANNARGVIVRDPDGHFVELLQPSPLPETIAPPRATSSTLACGSPSPTPIVRCRSIAISFSSSRRWDPSARFRCSI